MAKWNHELEQAKAVQEMIQSFYKSILELQQSLLVLQDSFIVAFKPRMEAFIATLDPDWIKRTDFQFTLEDWHVPSKWAEWVAFHLPDWFFS